MHAPADDLAARTRDILARLVGFDTTSRNSNLDLVAWVETYLAGHGVASQRIYDSSGAKAALWATIGPADRGGYVLSGHTDVVPVDGQAWTSDPFTLIARDGKLIGRGTTDMKGFLAVCLAMVPQMRAATLATPIHLAFSYDEEVGCIGVRGLIERLKTSPAKPIGCFVGEPTGMDVVIGHKGKRSMVTTVRGRACHSSLAPNGVNAVSYAAKLIAFIDGVGARLAASGPRDEAFDVPFTSAHVGIVHGGQALNIVPEACRLEWEIRSIAADDPDALVAEIEAHARTVLAPQMQARAPEAGFEFVLRSGFPGLDTEAEAPIARLAKHLAARNAHAKVAYGTEAGLFQEAGIPSVIVGPGLIAQAHTPDEFIVEDQLAACRQFVARLISHCAA